MTAPITVTVDHDVRVVRITLEFAGHLRHILALLMPGGSYSTLVGDEVIDVIIETPHALEFPIGGQNVISEE